MEILPRFILFLAVYHLIFFRKFYGNIFRMCTSEIASTFFPHWIWMGRNISKRKLPLSDNLWYYHPACIPFLSTWYPIQILTSWVGSFFKLDDAFKIYAYTILFHFILGSILAFNSLLYTLNPYFALFGALSLTYSAYFVKPLTPCAIYTHAWVLGALGGGKFGAFCFGMAILGGYWPTLVYIAPVLIFLHPIVALGAILGLPQIIPFLWYWPKSIRSGLKHDKNFGRVPLWRYIDLIIPNLTQNTINGVFWPEMAMYLGIVPFLALRGFSSAGLFWLAVGLLSLIVTIQRIPARSLYLLSFSLIMISLYSKIGYAVILIQSACLLVNSEIYPHFPFCQWWKRPSEFNYNNIKSWPGFTGYIPEIPTKGYTGGFCLKSTADRLGVKDPNGETTYG